MVRKLNILDVIDEQSGSGKLDLIIQLPYVVKTDSRKSQAEKRTTDIEQQLANLGITQEVLNGTADEKTMLNYTNRVVVPILSEIVDSMNIKFLTKTARTQGQKILFFNDPFKFIPISNIAEIAD